ncbi:MAG: prolyl oligopeptidase family serine peptidase, partial [Acidimicrobiales bacterium]
APRGRVISAPLDRPQAEHWVDVVPEGSAVIEALTIAGGSLLVSTSEHAVSHLWRYALDGSGGQEMGLPEPGAIVGIDAEPAVERAFVTFTSFARPPALWRWEAGESLEPWSHHVSPIDPARYEVRQVFYESTDGARVPMFLISQPGSSSPQPAVLTGYGGFAIASTPAFSPGIVAWCDAGGLYALAGIRGGGEYGEEWHEAGMRHRKQQVFDDFAAAAAWLADQGLTTPERLAIRGGSNGGLLVGATVTQRPDLCKAAVCAVPLLDMLRYDRYLIGALWVPEYGDPADPDDFKTLFAYSPYHRVVDGFDYPALLILTAESDSRVDPMHARKFAARMQTAVQGVRATQAGADSLILLRVESRAGHGLGKPRWKQADELADTWAFIVWQLGLPNPI